MGNTQQASWLHDCRHAEDVLPLIDYIEYNQNPAGNTLKLCS